MGVALLALSPSARADRAGRRAAVPGQPQRARTRRARTSRPTSTRRARPTTSTRSRSRRSPVSRPPKVTTSRTSTRPPLRCRSSTPRSSVQTFEQQQQVRAYYSVQQRARRRPLRDRRQGAGRSCSVSASSTRRGCAPTTRNWSNLHTVYTHGNGVIAAYANQRSEDDDAPVGRHPVGRGAGARRGALTNLTEGGYESRVYFGEQSPSLLHRRQAGGRRRRRARPAQGRARRREPDHDVRRCRRRADRRHLQQAALRPEVQRAQPRALEPGLRQQQDPLRPQPPADGGEGRARG